MDSEFRVGKEIVGVCNGWIYIYVDMWRFFLLVYSCF